MEYTFLELKQKEVINLLNGKRLGRVCDIIVTSPENKFIGIVVPSSQGFKFFSRTERVIEMKYIKKIGEDTILVEVDEDEDKKKGKKDCERKPPHQSCNPCNCNSCNDRRSYEEYE